MLDAQLKRGLLDVCVLAVLRKGDSYGYQIIKDLSGCIAISESTLYPILKRLEASNTLTDYSVEHNGRLRRFYRITDAGRKQLSDFLESWSEMNAVYEFVKESCENDA